MANRVRQLLTRSSTSTLTIETLAVPSYYTGVYSQHAISVVKASNKFLRDCKASDAVKIRKVCGRFIESIEGWHQLNPVNALIQVATIRDKVQETVSQIGKIAKQEFRVVPVDFEGIKRAAKELIDDEALVAEARALSKERAELLLGSLQLIIDMRSSDRDAEGVLKLLKDVSDSTNTLPCNDILDGLEREDEPFRTQDYALTYKAKYNGVDVALTVVQEVRMNAHVSKRWRHHVISWRQLDHENIAKIIGVCSVTPCSFVSSFYPSGNVRDYLKTREEAGEEVNYARLVDGITAGVEYLHTRAPEMTHGDLRGQNILVTDEGVAQITDYGLALFQHNVHRSSTFYKNDTSVRWTAPEISEDPQNANTIRRSTVESDIYSMGMTLFEIITGQDPFHDMEDLPAIRMHVQRNGRPELLPDQQILPQGRYMPLIEECWKQRPEDRITIHDVRFKLAQIDMPASVPPSPTSTARFSTGKMEPREIEAYAMSSSAGSISSPPRSQGSKSVLGITSSPHGIKSALGSPLPPVAKSVSGSISSRSPPRSPPQSISPRDSGSVLGSISPPSSDTVMLAADNRSIISSTKTRSSLEKVKKRLPFKIPFGRKQESKALASLDEEPERRVTVALDRGSQELVVGGAKADVDEVMAELELMIGMYQGNQTAEKLFMSKRARLRLSLEDSRETVRLASLGTGDLSIRIDPENGAIYILGPREQVLAAREVVHTVLHDIDNESTVYFNADPEDVKALRGSIHHIVKRCRMTSNKLHHEIFIHFPPADSPSSTIRLDGQPDLVDAILNAYESGEWKDDVMATLDCPLSCRTVYPLMRSRIHQISPLEEIAYPGVVLTYLPQTEEVKSHQTIRLVGTRRECNNVVDTIKERIKTMRRDIFIITSPPREQLADLGLRKMLEDVRVVVEDLGPDDRAEYTDDPDASVWVLTAINKIDLKLAVGMLRRPDVTSERHRQSRLSQASDSIQQDPPSPVDIVRG